MSNLPGKPARFLHRSRREKALFLEAWLRLGWARFLVLTAPFPKLAGEWGTFMLETFNDPPPQPDFVRMVKEAVGSASRHTPWKSNCLPQAVAAMRMLKKRGLCATLYLGLRRGPDGGLAAHAWLRCGDVYVTGGSSPRFTVVGTFAETQAVPSAAFASGEAGQAFHILKKE